MERGKKEERTTSEEDDKDHPLKGVRYAALTAPGPTGLRAEHLKDLILCRDKRIGNKLTKALLEMQNK